MSRSIAVVGPIPKDKITTHNQEVFEKLGCVTHPVIGISKLFDDRGKVIPITHVREQDAGKVKELFQPYSNIEMSGITSSKDQGDIIELTFLDANKRSERQTGFMDPIVPRDMEPFLDADAFVFIPITDYEVPLHTLKHVKENSNGLIIFDAHGPTCSVDIFGKRYLKYWVDLDEWLPYIDVLKMNREEAHCCLVENYYNSNPDDEHPEASEEEMDKLAERCIQGGLQALIVTMDERGCMLYTKDKKKLVPPVKVGPIVDTTGAGDSFAGGLAFGWLETQDFEKATWYANLMGAMRTQGSTFEVFKNFEDGMKIIGENYS